MVSSGFKSIWSRVGSPSIDEFVASFRDDYACAEYLAKNRWPNGFECPHCGSRKAWRLEARPWLWECAGKGNKPSCRHQTSVISGTIMQGSHLPLRKWFLAAYLVSTHSNGISARQLQPKLGVSYKTAWLLLHKLRRAMIDPDDKPLRGDIDVDETAIPYRRKADHLKRGGGSSTANQIWIVGAVEKPDRFSVGRIRLARIADRSSTSLTPFLEANTLPGSELRTDENAAYRRVPERGLKQVNLSKSSVPAHISFKWVHIVFANLKRWALGTFHGFREKHLDAYLNEFAFRWNQRLDIHSAMDTMLRIGRRIGPVSYRSIVGDTSEWRKQNVAKLINMLHPNKRKIVLDLAKHYRVPRLEVMDNLVKWMDRLFDEDLGAYLGYKWKLQGVPEFKDIEPRRKTKPRAPVLVPRRPGEERRTDRRYHNPQAKMPRIIASFPAQGRPSSKLPVSN